MSHEGCCHGYFPDEILQMLEILLNIFSALLEDHRMANF